MYNRPDAVILYVIHLKNMTRLRYGTKTLLVLIAICALALGWYAKAKSDALTRTKAAARLQLLGCQTLRDTEFERMISSSISVNGLKKTRVSPLIKKDTSLPNWYQKLLGPEMFWKYQTVALPQQPSFKLNEIANEIADLNFLENLIVYENDFSENDLETFSQKFNNINIKTRSAAKFRFSVYGVDSVKFE